MTSRPSAAAPTQDRLFLSPPHMSGDEIKLIKEAFASNFIAPAGPMISRFEEDFCQYTGFAHAVALSSGTAALHLGLHILNLGPSDVVFAPTMTFIGGVEPIIYQGAIPVFIDADPETLGMDVDLLAGALDDSAKNGVLPKAIVCTDLFGQSCNLDAIVSLGEKYGVPVLADSCEAVGALHKGKHAGKGAWAATYSFNGNKIMTTSGGGMLASDDKRIIDRARYLSTQARQPVVHYEHTEVGFNYRLSNICAAIGVGQLAHIEERVARRRAIFTLYQELLGNLPGISFMGEAPGDRSTRWLSVIYIDPKAFGVDREHVRLALEAQNIEARPVWKPMHAQPVFRGTKFIGGDVADRVFERGLCLPSGSQMTDADVKRVCEVLVSSRKHG